MLEVIIKKRNTNMELRLRRQSLRGRVNNMIVVKQARLSIQNSESSDTRKQRCHLNNKPKPSSKPKKIMNDNTTSMSMATISKIKRLTMIIYTCIQLK